MKAFRIALVTLVVLLPCFPAPSPGSEGIAVQLSVYRAEGVRLARPGSVQVVQLHRSGKREIGDLLAEGYPGVKFRLLTFPAFTMPSGKPFSVQLGSLGAAAFRLEPGDTPALTAGFLLNGKSWPDSTAAVSASGGSVYYLLGAPDEDNATWLACADVAIPSGAGGE